MMDSYTSENNLIISTNKDIIKRFFKLYKKAVLFVITPLIFMPIIFIGENNAYPNFYIFLVTATYLIGDIMHPGVISLVPVAYFTFMNLLEKTIINTIHVQNSVLDCLGVMIIILALEHSHLDKRIGLKILLMFGCSHFRLSFLLFFITTVLSMWFSNTMACGIMMPLVKSILKELEKMGILETCEMSGNTHNSAGSDKMYKNQQSSCIGGMATYVGSETNQIFKNYCAVIFPNGPNLEFPHYVLLTLPGVLVMEMFLYFWLNFYFLGMLRVQNYTALQTSLSSEEEQYISILLDTQYRRLGKIKFQEMVVCAVVVLAGILQSTIIFSNISRYKVNEVNRSVKVAAPSIICVILLFVSPADLECMKFFRKRRDNFDPLPTAPSSGCLTWTIVNNNINWSVLFITASTNITFESLKDSKMTEEFEKFLTFFSDWPTPGLAFIVIVFCKIMTEFANNATVEHCLLPHVANVAMKARINPLFLMLSATISNSLPFHLTTGTPAYAMVSAYVNIPPRKMIIAGVGQSVAAILTNLFLVCVWSKVIWPDIDVYPEWADVINLNRNK